MTTTNKRDSVWVLYLIIFPSCIKVCPVCEHLLTRWSSWSWAAEHWPRHPAARWAGRACSSPRGPPAAGGPPRPWRWASGWVWTGMDWTGGVDRCTRVKQHGPKDVAMLTGQQCALLLLLSLPPSPPPTSLAPSPHTWWIKDAVQQNYASLSNATWCIDINTGGV